MCLLSPKSGLSQGHFLLAAFFPVCGISSCLFTGLMIFLLLKTVQLNSVITQVSDAFLLLFCCWPFAVFLVSTYLMTFLD